MVFVLRSKEPCYLYPDGEISCAHVKYGSRAFLLSPPPLIFSRWGQFLSFARARAKGERSRPDRGRLAIDKLAARRKFLECRATGLSRFICDRLIYAGARHSARRAAPLKFTSADDATGPSMGPREPRSPLWGIYSRIAAW